MMRTSKFLTYVLFISLFYSCNQTGPEQKLFKQLSATETGIDFNNTILENDTLNILTFEYIYNGGGVAVFDFNNDGLMDLYFTGNMVPNKFYENLGDMNFKDITSVTGTGASEYWSSGVAIIDINNDGYKDIYIATTNKEDASQRENLLYINNYGQQGELAFTESAEEYGINDTSYCTNSAFFDYDNDGDLDLFLITNKIKEFGTPGTYRRKKNDKRSGRVDKLYRNDFDSTKVHAFYTDVSDEAGIIYDGFALGLNIADINRDGWKDIYISNDFISVDLLYINNQDGTFTNQADHYFKHVALAAMGNEIEDLNNDGLADILTVEMQPEYNYRKKTMMSANNYTSYINNDKLDYVYQYSRNMLQVNNGAANETGNLPFSEVAMYSGIHATDWSWTPLVADFDLDGKKDIVITNGFPKDITDKDFINYQASNMAYIDKGDLLPLIPEVKLHNYGFKNEGDLNFKNVSIEWGLDIPSFSNGAVYADFDLDGDLDIVINAINDEALVYQNTSEIEKKNIIKLKIRGLPSNKDGLGTIVEYQSENIKGLYEHSPYRGYLSSLFDDKILSFGADTLCDIKVFWPDGSISLLNNVKTSQTLNLDQQVMSKATNSIESEVNFKFYDTINLGLSIFTEEVDYVDFNTEPLLLHKLSQFGPGISVGDANNDGLEDFYISGSAGHSGKLFLQRPDHSFVESEAFPNNKEKEEQGSLFFDADNDGDLEIYIPSGSNQFEAGDSLYKDVLLVNENGKFTNIEKNKLPIPNISSSSVRAADFDLDGDLDLIVTGRSEPGNYPIGVSSYLLENKSIPENVSFEIANDNKAPVLNDIGLVTDALWTDFNNDGWQDLILVAEWSSPIFLQNNKGKFVNETLNSGLASETGWWNSINSGDFDGDGDMDYILGNFGLNSAFNVSDDRPLRLYYKDIDKNGSLDIFPSVYYKDSVDVYREFSYFTRADLAKEISSIRSKFTNYSSHGMSEFTDMFTEDEKADLRVLEAKMLESSLIENLGGGKFKRHSLPWQAQLAPIYGVLCTDVNLDGHLDLILNGNDFGVELTIGKIDALNGLVLLGDGKLGFQAIPSSSSGFFVPGDGKAIASIVIGDEEKVIASQNNGQLLIFDRRVNATSIRSYAPKDYDTSILIYDGKDQIIRKHEFSYGSGFMSQSTRRVYFPENASYFIVSRSNDGNVKYDL